MALAVPVKYAGLRVALVLRHQVPLLLSDLLLHRCEDVLLELADRGDGGGGVVGHDGPASEILHASATGGRERLHRSFGSVALPVNLMNELERSTQVDEPIGDRLGLTGRGLVGDLVRADRPVLRLAVAFDANLRGRDLLAVERRRVRRRVDDVTAADREGGGGLVKDAHLVAQVAEEAVGWELHVARPIRADDRLHDRGEDIGDLRGRNPRGEQFHTKQPELRVPRRPLAGPLAGRLLRHPHLVLELRDSSPQLLDLRVLRLEPSLRRRELDPHLRRLLVDGGVVVLEFSHGLRVRLLQSGRRPRRRRRRSLSRHLLRLGFSFFHLLVRGLQLRRVAIALLDLRGVVALDQRLESLLLARGLAAVVLALPLGLE